MFNDEANNTSGESSFFNIKLETFFDSDEEKQTFAKIKDAISSATDQNIATKQIYDLGEKGVSVLLKILKKTTFPL